MAASNDQGNMKFWFNGMPILGLKRVSTNDNGNMQYWVDGCPFMTLFPASAPSGGLIKTVNGLAVASVKQWNGLTFSTGVKTFNGLSNV